MSTPHRDPAETPPSPARHTPDHSGAFGVSDDRRAELERLESEAGTAADDSEYSQRPRNQAGNTPAVSTSDAAGTPPIHAFDLTPGVPTPGDSKP